jgi:hypothetical protein
MVLMAPYERDATRWLDMPWINRYSGREYRLTLKPFAGRVRPSIVRPRTYRDVLTSYLANEESKSKDPDGTPCEPGTVGLLRRRPVRMRTVTHIGKESNRLEDAQTGLIEDIDEVVNEYDDYYNRVFVPLVVPPLRALGVRKTARLTGHSAAAVSRVLTTKHEPARPHRRQLPRYVEVAADFVREQLAEAGHPALDDRVAALRQYAEMLRGPRERRPAPGGYTAKPLPS